MRCGCPHCDAYMVQSEGERKDCVCPDCGYSCNACQGTNTVMSLAEIKARQEELLQALGQVTAPKEWDREP